MDGDIKRTVLPPAGPEEMAKSARHFDPYTGRAFTSLDTAMRGISWGSDRRAVRLRHEQHVAATTQRVGPQDKIDR